LQYVIIIAVLSYKQLLKALIGNNRTFLKAIYSSIKKGNCGPRCNWTSVAILISHYSIAF